VKPLSIAAAGRSRSVRGTQLLVEHMSSVLRRPSLTAIELGWSWLIGLPILWVCRQQALKILAAYPLQQSGFNSIDTQNPWVAAVQVANVWAYYQPHVLAVLGWLLPCAALAWVVISALGRSLLLKRMAPQERFRPMSMIALQAAWLALLAATLFAWFKSIQWVASTHISALGEPDLVGYSIWTIFLTLGFFTAFALLSWPLSIAPVLMLLERCSAISSLGRSFRLGSTFTGKLAEINLVMGIVKLALMVLAMVFSAAPLPFSDELGPSAMHVVWLGSVVFFLVASGFFQVVRMKAFVEFWKIFRGKEQLEANPKRLSA
jgi:hypothetical protein